MARSTSSSRITLQQLAGYRASRTRLANQLALMQRAGSDATECDAISDRLAKLDSVISGSRVIKASATAQSVKAIKAHCTRARAKLSGTRGKARAALLAKIADFESRIAELVNPAPAPVSKPRKAGNVVSLAPASEAVA